LGWIETSAEAILKSPPARKFLTRVERSPSGRRLLNSLSGQRGVFSSFAEGWSAARSTGLAGHEDASEIDVHLRLSKSLRQSDYPALFWLARAGGGKFRVFDFGGNVGNLYYSYRPYLEELGPVEWTVFDLPSIVDRGREIAAQRRAHGLRFATSAKEFSSSQVLLVSGALHYWPATISEFIEQFGVQPEQVIINRIPVQDRSPSFVTVQRTQSCAFPCLVRNESEMIAEFLALGYRLLDTWQAPELRLGLPLFPERQVAHYSGFYFCLPARAGGASER
jgi:putative methyltransferase (TIGR04325 family)